MPSKGHNCCCVVGCKNNGRNCEDVRFYAFPTAFHKIPQREKWIAAVNRKNPDGTPWLPKPSSRICSQHFIGNAKSESQLSPSYFPTIFPDGPRKRKDIEESALNRHLRFIKRRVRTFVPKDSTLSKDSVNSRFTLVQMKAEEHVTMVDEGTQVDFLYETNENSMTFTCNRYVCNNICNAETQTEINICTKRFVFGSKRKGIDKCCGDDKLFRDAACGPNSKDQDVGFSGFGSIKNKEQMMDLTGVTHSSFQLLLKLMPESDKNKVSSENRLLIFLFKMKTGLSFDALSALFAIHRTTVSRIFTAILKHLAFACKDFVVWPTKQVVRSTMPEAFKKNYNDCRVIVECIEIPVKKPSTVDKCVEMYSSYKREFTAKILVGCTPSGIVSFVSKYFGGRTTSSLITTRCGLLDLLEPGDVILADKEFSGVKNALDENRKDVLIVMPPFLHESIYSRQDGKQTYKVASVRMHIERIMQRIKSYRILGKLSLTLLPYCDDIIFMCCVLVNLQPQITKQKESESMET